MPIAGVEISRASGINFPFLHSIWDNVGISNGYYCDDHSSEFTQVFLTTDTLYIQYKLDTFAISFISINADTYNAYQVDSVNNIFNYAIPLSGYPDSTIYVNIHIAGITNPGIDTLGRSLPIKVIDVTTLPEGCPLALVQWRNSCPAMGVDYSLDTNFFHQMRVPLLRLRPAANDDEELKMEKNSEGVWEFCSSDLSEVYSFTTSPIPDWMHQVLRKAMQHDTFMVNGAQFVKQSSFSKILQDNALYVGEAQLIPVNQPYKVDNCCDTGAVFVVPPNGQLTCDTTAETADHFAVDTRLSRDSAGMLITAATTGLSYVYNFGGVYFAQIQNGADPTLPASWSYLAGSGTQAEFETNIVANIVVPTGGWAGYFELPDSLLTTLGLQIFNLTVTLIENGIGSQSAVCVISASSGDPECPIPTLASSDFTGLPTIRISHEGSTDSDTPANLINGNANYSFSHVWYAEPCQTPQTQLPLFTVSGVGGSTSLTFSSWHPSILAAGQPVIEALFSGGMGGTGYTVDKQILVQTLIGSGLTPAGGDWCIRATAVHIPTSCQAQTQLTVPGGLALINHAAIFMGTTPLGDTNTTIGVANYANQNGQFGAGTMGPEISDSQFWLEGDITLGDAVGNQTTLDSDLTTLQLTGVGYTSALATNVLSAMYIRDSNGQRCFTSFYSRWDNATDANYVRPRWAAFPVAGLTNGGVDLLFRPSFEAGGTGGLATETQQGFTSELRRYPIDGGDIIFTGNEDPEGGGGSPLVAALDPSGTIVATTNPSGLQVIHAAPQNGTYYCKWEITTSGGLTMQHIQSATVLNY